MALNCEGNPRVWIVLNAFRSNREYRNSHRLPFKGCSLQLHSGCILGGESARLYLTANCQTLSHGDEVSFGLAWFDLVWFGLIWFDLV